MAASEEEVVAFLREHPDVATQQVMRALGVSARVVRRAERRLDATRGTRRRRRRATLVVLALGVVGALGGRAAYRRVEQEREQQRAANERARAERVAAQERDIYTALDQRDVSRADEIAAQLASEDEAVRLAALRFLHGVVRERYAAQLLALVDDPASRVRLAAIQLVGTLPGEAVEVRLVAVVLDAQRAMAERQLALASLRARSSADSRALARRLLPALLDPSVRGEAVSALERLTGQSVRPPESTPEAAHRAWAAALGETP